MIPLRSKNFYLLRLVAYLHQQNMFNQNGFNSKENQSSQYIEFFNVLNLKSPKHWF